MSIYLTEAEEWAIRHPETDLPRPRQHHVAPPRPRTRTRVATGLRRVADRLEQ